jgi:hypothetical protein
MAGLREHVAQSVKIILQTAKGERVMRPGFGCGIHALVFSPMNPATEGLAAHEVREALRTWEPRINVVDVVVSGQGEGRMVVDLTYELAGTGELARETVSLGSPDRGKV